METELHGGTTGSFPTMANATCILSAAIILLAASLWTAGNVQAEGGRELVPGISYDASITFEIATERNYDVDNSVRDDIATTEPEFNLSLYLDGGGWFTAMTELELSRVDFIVDERGSRRKGWEFDVKQAYFDFPQIFDYFSLRFGRQEFKDALEWLYDEDLDAARLFYKNGSFESEFSVSRRHLLDVDLLNRDKSDEINNYMALGRYRFDDKTHADAYVLFRDERAYAGNIPEDLLFLGVQSIGEISSSTSYWFNAAYVTGDVWGQNISGFGIDGGATYVFDAPVEPAITLGVAFGSGDKDPSSGTDNNFRQTGLQDNNQRFNGVERFKYFGEMLEPELSNMLILTAGAGIRPSDKSSIDVVYHYYRQANAANSLRKTNLNTQPNGISKDLGHGLDVIFGHREIENVDFEAVFGAFFPGNAFSPGADNAYFGKFEVSIGF